MKNNTPTAAAYTYFASGVNRPNQMIGFARAGHHIGVAVDELSRNGIEQLKSFAGTDTLVFVDSGAYSEVEFGPAGREVVKPIVNAEWIKRISIMVELAVALGGNLYTVAPDSVGSQVETLERLARYRDQVRAMHAAGANVLVCIQKGEMSQADFRTACADVLGFDDFVDALPCKKAATTMDELAAYLRDAQPERLHLLGLGERNDDFAIALAHVATYSPATVLFCDSCLLRGTVGRTGGKGGGPRLLTACNDLAKELIATGRSVEPNNVVLSCMLAFGPSRWLAAAEARLAA